MQQLIFTNIPMDLSNFTINIHALPKVGLHAFLLFILCYLQTFIALREKGFEKNSLNEEQTFYF